MNIELRRYGIVIKTIPITGDKASIGSGAGSDILIEDPYLAAHVGDLARRGDVWYITDTGTSLDGITRDGARIDDEPIAEGKIYSVSGFELVAQFQPAPHRPADRNSPRADRVVPGTIMESFDNLRDGGNLIPGTVVEPMPELRRRPAEIPRTVFEPMPVPPAPVGIPGPPVGPPVAAPPARTSSGRRILLLSVFAMGLVLLLVLILARGGGKKKETASKAPVPQSIAVTTAPAAPAPPAAVVSATDLLRSLEYDRALTRWEEQLATADDPAIRARYAELALEVGRIHAANQSSGARAYFERAVKWGPASGNEAVDEAKRRLGN